MWVYAVILFVVACVAWTYSRARVKIEPFAAGKSPSDMLTSLKGINSEMTDALNTNTYRSQYEDLILELEKWADLSMLTMISQDLTSNSANVGKFNDLSVFKKTLNDSMAFLDNN
jgi:hypothetical protein